MENIEAMLCAYIEGDLDEQDREAVYRYLLRKPDAIKKRSVWPLVRAAGNARSADSPVVPP